MTPALLLHSAGLLAVLLTPGRIRVMETGQTSIRAALAQLGGAERIAAVPTWTVEGRGRENLTAELAGISPNHPTWRPHDERVTVDVRSGAVSWDRRTPRNDQSLRWRRFVMRSDSSGFYDWVVERGALRAAPTTESRRRAMARRIPHLLLEEAARSTRIEWLGQRRLNGSAYEEVQVLLADGAVVNLMLRRSPAVLGGLEYRIDLPGRGPIAVTWEWRGWKADPHLGMKPSGHRIEVDGVLFQEVVYDRYGAGGSDVAQALGIPSSRGHHPMVETHGNQVGLAPFGEVAPGVHVLDVGGFTVGFVELRDFVVAFEAPAYAPGLEAIPATHDARNLTGALIDSIARACPGKPLRYAVISHHHSDHLGGAAAYAARGVTLLVAPGHRRAAARAAQATGVTAAIETVSKRRVFDDGARRVEVMNVGRNPHTDENLFVWLPKERIGFQGDLFYFDEGGAFPPSGRGTMNRFFARWLDRHGIRPRGIYGVHNDAAVGEEWLLRAMKD